MKPTIIWMKTQKVIINILHLASKRLCNFELGTSATVASLLQFGQPIIAHIYSAQHLADFSHLLSSIITLRSQISVP